MELYSESDWEGVDPLLGTMPDRKLEKLVPMSRTSIRNRRDLLGIPPYGGKRKTRVVHCPRGELSYAACLFAVRRWA